MHLYYFTFCLITCSSIICLYLLVYIFIFNFFLLSLFSNCPLLLLQFHQTLKRPKYFFSPFFASCFLFFSFHCCLYLPPLFCFLVIFFFFYFHLYTYTCIALGFTAIAIVVILHFTINFIPLFSLPQFSLNSQWIKQLITQLSAALLSME